MMKYQIDLLEVAHKHSIFNQDEISKSLLCSCFYCLQSFNSNEILEWVDNDNPSGKSALCPKCGIDSVLGDSSSFPINDDTFLKEMYSYWF